MKEMNKKLLLIIPVLVIAVVLMFPRNKASIEVSNIVSEYKNPINLNAKDFINTKDEKVLNSVSYDLSNVTLEKDKDYPKIGKYNVKVTYEVNNKVFSKNMLLEVKDTTKPEFIDFKDKVVISLNERIDLNTLYKAYDQSDTTISIDDSDVDYSKVGSYKLIISATDAHSNYVSKEATLTIQS